MKKITEIKETRFRTVREKDALGNRTTKQIPYTGNRPVQVVTHGVRFAHFFIDLMIYYFVYEFIAAMAVVFDSVRVDPVTTVVVVYNVSLVSFLSFPIYYILFEHFFQKTPGKFLTKTRVIDIYNNKPDFKTNVLRNIIRLIPFEGISCALNERGWHDTWSDTFVVKDEEYLKIKDILINETEIKGI